MKYYNKGIKAHLVAMQELLDDDHLVFSNTFGVGPIDIVRVNIHTGFCEFFDAKSDRDRAHRKRPFTALQKKLGVQQFYVNFHKRTWKLVSKLGKF